MKKLVKENINFERGMDPKKGLDVGIENSKMPHLRNNINKKYLEELYIKHGKSSIDNFLYKADLAYIEHIKSSDMVNKPAFLQNVFMLKGKNFWKTFPHKHKSMEKPEKY